MKPPSTPTIKRQENKRSLTDQRLAAFGYRVGMLHRLYNLCVKPAMVEIGLSVSLIPVLGELFHEDGITQETLSARVHLDKGSTARAVEKLESIGLVRRIENGQNRRQKLVYLTDKAHDKREAFFAPLYEWSWVMSKDFTLSESKKMLKYFDIMTENLSTELAVKKAAR